jgi:type IV pilus assembly protein PilM
MLKTKSFLCGDFGAGTLKLAEFERNEVGSLRLINYAVKPLGAEGSQDASRSAAILQALQEALSEKPFQSRMINICAAGYSVFSKFVKLPPVDTAKVTQIIQYEAQQNVPFPLEDVVWDYQILGATPTGELEVLLVAIKTDTVEGLFRTVEQAGLKVHLVDVTAAALCNAFRYSYGDEEGCTMLLDIGAKTSNLLFFEKGKVFSRSINIGANSITQDFASESRLSFAEAEQIKVKEGFVSLGGAYEEPENPYQAQISKIARQVMTRLHIQMNQTIQFYRGQQGGSAPQRLYLAGGASLMPYTAQFFAEKLNLPVDYFNPFRSVELSPEINLEEIAQVAHTFGEVVGLSIRNLAQCPVELNLMPKSHLKQQQFRQKQPYFVATVFSLVLVVLAFGAFYNRVAMARREKLAQIREKVEPLNAKQGELSAAITELNADYAAANEIAGVLSDRTYWQEILGGLQGVFFQFEAEEAKKYNTDTGVWIENMTLHDPDAPPPGRLGPQAPAVAQRTVFYLQLHCRAANLKRVEAAANDKYAAALVDTLKTNVLFVADNTKLSGTLNPVEPSATTFDFHLVLQLKRPLKVY